MTVRLTEEEYLDLCHMMDYAGYRSLSKFIRTRIFASSAKIIRHPLQDQTLAEQIRNLVYQVKKIGVNYNQLVKAYNRDRGKSGSYATENMMSQIYRLTGTLVSDVASIKHTISNCHDH